MKRWIAVFLILLTFGSAFPLVIFGAAKAQPVTLSFMFTSRPKTDQQDFYLDILPQLVKEKFPEITLTVDTLPTDQYKNTIKSRLAAGEGPDVFTWWAFGLTEQMVGADYFMDLSSDRRALPFLKKMKPDLLKGFTVHGKVYAIPRGTTFLGTFYNKEMFKKAKIAKIPTDWPAFLAACEKLKAAGMVPIVASDKDWARIQYMLYNAAASLLYSDDPDYDAKLISGKAKFTDAKWINMLSKMKTLYDKGYIIKNSLGIGGEQAFQLFNDGKAAMIFDGTWDLLSLTKKGAADFERGMFALPTNEPGKPLYLPFSIDSGFVVNRFTKNKASVFKVLNYLYRDGTPLNKAFKQSMTPAPPNFGGISKDPLFGNYLGLYKHNKTHYFCNAYWPDGVATTLCMKFQECLIGSISVEEVAAATERKLREIQMNNP
ncbi:raffinose/stachyose/melibiose transport system substrate-binding protein [Hydrogenispora ethanolica]|uniref:Raffinose/stachyose/melibiose transport system substrate-binding protein n=1 Tax=Hydrogenispora ethanolica TaxID=1082276 RepID=A0A4R1R8K4_HYDET|nr:extracellular solute-binding protein [Hydrogenispora ethanolica]TCL61993.1 raffinose/stachyose/melibiose transport system substrate-binding protein [Hydrogenispora ethanolica]